jgi:hypothetical protein
MRRRLINLLTIASLLLCVAVAALWVRSYWIADQALFCAGERLCGMHAVRGRIGLNWTSSDSYWSDANVGTGWQHTPTIRIIPPDPDLDQVYRDHFLGFAIDQFPFTPNLTTSPQTNHVLVIPHWSLVAACLVLPGLLARSRRRRLLRRRPGLCSSCGYNLTANVSGVCPECGEPRRT